MLAFNEICEARGLTKDTVIDALKTALVSAYRRNTNVSNTQGVRVEIDPRTGEPTIFAEKEAVDSIIDDRTEVLLDEAKRYDPDVEMGDMVMVDSTPQNFGRIAAQTAKQVILQRVREAERDQLYDEFASREGEIINGTVQSVSGQNITIGLGRTEAILPKSQQVQGERYRPHDKIRVYLLEVRRTNRGPQIYVSRNHRNLLRRLLELEVPEIYNGQVDIKSIAREAGARSKVAVMALQPGVDPVGACVGMRGVRIQSIVRELNDEKIDVIEWDPDQRNFIAKALSPARVSQVFLEDHPETGKTASVIVPDDQLSLAIGREGQNARLAAKLTGWRIDIKSLTEAASEAMNNIDDPAVPANVAKDANLREQVAVILEKKAANRPITAEDYGYLNRMVSGVEGNIVNARAVVYDALREKKNAARDRVSKEVWDADLGVLDISERVYDLLLEHDFKNVGELLYKMELGDDELLELTGFGPKAFEEVKDAIDLLIKEDEEAKAAEAAAAALAEAEAAAEAGEEIAAEAEETEAEEEAEAEVEAVAETEEAEEEVVEVEEAEPVVAEVAEVAEEAEPVVAEVEVEPVAVAEAEPAVAVEEEPEEVPAAAEAVPAAEEGGEEIVGIQPLEPLLETAAKRGKKKPSIVVVSREEEEEEEEDDSGRGRTKKGRQLVFDENAGRVVTKRKRKRRGSQEPSWEDFDDDF
ncbi:MAG: transcription termination/antitermination protein NusA [Anaerolineales bacterium]|nr:transcription termination/antitermination protein NusA [Anaerolineales bacterium]MCB0019112.1 transcription termination/antitermination protein NusA [Anaerolineales bacterium]MCB0028600.1 transcription termination/antitermination protein NusA [Anaerolineales bacterium]